jgi:serine/threonine protein kinase
LRVPDSSERIGRYQLLEPIGGGPNGSVWRAKVFGVAGFERQFAIKRFHPELTASPTTAQSLSAAARSYGSLEHPRIARMSEFGVAQGQTFTAVELVAGLDATRLVAESKLAGSGLPSGGSLALISQVARAVGYAHGRGLSHLGLAPSNVIVTVDGDVKVTDFGILASTMPQHPVESPRLAPRIGYIAPEQLVGEATSAATDVYVLGVIAYELVTGQRAFYGDTPQALAHAILAGPPADPPLPRPIVRVLTRCLARSQFERFPDARAFADALDAALRVAPVPGTRKEVGAQVKATLDRHAAMNDGNLSGMVALNMIAPSPPIVATPPPIAHSIVTDDGLSTNQFVRPDAPVPRPSPLIGPRTKPGMESAREPAPSATLPELSKQPLTTTVPGLTPPIPVPQGVGGAQPQIGPPAIPPVGSKTMLGVPPAKLPIPSINSRQPVAVPTIPKPAPGMKGTIEIPKIAPALRGPVPPPGPAMTVVSPPDEHGATTATHVAFDHNKLAQLELSTSKQSDEPATAPYSIIPEDDPLLDSIDVLAPPPRPLEPTETSPSIQVIRGSDPDLPEHRPPDSRDLPTGEMPPELVDDLKRMSADSPYANDPLVAMSLEAVGKPVALAPEPPPRRPSPPAAPMTLPNEDSGGLATRREGPSPMPPRRRSEPRDTAVEAEPPTMRNTPAQMPRMPSPTPPSLVPPQAAKPAFINVSTQTGPLAPIPQLATSAIAPPGAPVQSTTPGMGPASFTLRPRARKRWPVIAVVAIVAAGGGVAAWQLTSSDEPTPIAKPTTKPATKPSTKPAAGSGSAVIAMTNAKSDAAVGSATGVAAGSATGVATGSATVATTGSATVAATGSATVAATGSATVAATGSATVAATGSATVATNSATVATNSATVAATGSATKPVGTPTSDALQITSTPPGARVFIDGADQGVTPVKLSGTSDRHTMALLLAAHDLYVAEVDGHGAFSIPLTQITPSGGPAGIKVIKCKDKDRYYVYVDGKATGMTCPTERIDCTTGPHTVEVYDVVTETRRKWDITVTDTRLSYRVRIE